MKDLVRRMELLDYRATGAISRIQEGQGGVPDFDETDAGDAVSFIDDRITGGYDEDVNGMRHTLARGAFPYFPPNTVEDPGTWTTVTSADARTYSEVDYSNGLVVVEISDAGPKAFSISDTFYNDRLGTVVFRSIATASETVSFIKESDLEVSAEERTFNIAPGEEVYVALIEGYDWEEDRSENVERAFFGEGGNGSRDRLLDYSVSTVTQPDGKVDRIAMSLEGDEIREVARIYTSGSFDVTKGDFSFQAPTLFSFPGGSVDVVNRTLVSAQGLFYDPRAGVGFSDVAPFGPWIESVVPDIGEGSKALEVMYCDDCTVLASIRNTSCHFYKTMNGSNSYDYLFDFTTGSYISHTTFVFKGFVGLAIFCDTESGYVIELAIFDPVQGTVSNIPAVSIDLGGTGGAAPKQIFSVKYLDRLFLVVSNEVNSGTQVIEVNKPSSQTIDLAMTKVTSTFSLSTWHKTMFSDGIRGASDIGIIGKSTSNGDISHGTVHVTQDTVTPMDWSDDVIQETADPLWADTGTHRLMRFHRLSLPRLNGFVGTSRAAGDIDPSLPDNGYLIFLPPDINSGAASVFPADLSQYEVIRDYVIQGVPYLVGLHYDGGSIDFIPVHSILNGAPEVYQVNGQDINSASDFVVYLKDNSVWLMVANNDATETLSFKLNFQSSRVDYETIHYDDADIPSSP